MDGILFLRSTGYNENHIAFSKSQSLVASEERAVDAFLALVVRSLVCSFVRVGK